MTSPITVKPIRLVPATQLVVAFGSVTSSYTRVGTSNFNAGITNILITSTFDHPVQISFDGVNDHLPILSATNGTLTPINLDGSQLPGYLGVWIKTLGTGPTSGNLYVSYFTQPVPPVVNTIPS